MSGGVVSHEAGVLGAPSILPPAQRQEPPTPALPIRLSPAPQGLPFPESRPQCQTCPASASAEGREGQRSRLADAQTNQVTLCAQRRRAHHTQPPPPAHLTPQPSSVLLEARHGSHPTWAPVPPTHHRDRLPAEKPQIKSWGRMPHASTRWGLSARSAGACLKGKSAPCTC